MAGNALSHRSEKDASLHSDLRRRQRSDFDVFDESADHMWSEYVKGAADKRGAAREYLNRYASGVETHPEWDDRNRERKRARNALMAGRDVPMPAAPAYDPVLKQLAAPATEQAVEDMAPSPFAPINHGPDHGAFRQSEHDTRPWRETSERGIVHPFETSGFTGKTTWGALPRMAGGRSFETFGDIVAGRQVNEAEIAEGASDATAFMTSGGLAQMRPKNSVGMFGGIRAKTADHGALSKAQAAEASGTPREQIWQDHGWFKGVDGKWRFEIDDSASTFSHDRDRQLDHPGMFGAYPDAKSSYQYSVPGDGGSQQTIGTGRSIIKVGTDNADPRSTSLHEFQHHVQDEEGFARGGNLGAGTLARSEWTPEITAASDRVDKMVAIANDPSRSMSDRSAAERMAREFGQSRTLMEQAEHYHRLGGEVESRAVQARRDLTPEQRRARAPWLDYDVPESQQIVKFGGDGQQMSANPKQSAAASLAENLGKSAGRDLDGLGYYSAALEAAKSWPQPKGSPEQALAWLTKNGTKLAEIDATGVGKAFAGQKQITREDLVKYLGENRTRLNEARYGGHDIGILGDTTRADTLARIEEFERLAIEQPNNARYFLASAQARKNHLEMKDTVVGPAKWSGMSLDESNPTYRETVLSLSDADIKRSGYDFVDPHFKGQKGTIGHIMWSLNKHDGKTVWTGDQIQSTGGQKIRDGGVRDEAKIAELKDRAWQAGDALRQFESKVPHGKHPSTIRSEDGSYPHAKLQAEFDRLHAEYKTAEASAPGHPLVNTTDQWTNTTLRRGLQQAIDAEAEYMAIPSGKTVLGYNPGDEHGMTEFYDKIVPKNLGNMLAKLDKAGLNRQYVPQLETPSGMRGDGFSLFQITPEMREAARRGLPLFSNPATGAVMPMAGYAGQDDDRHVNAMMPRRGASR